VVVAKGTYGIPMRPDRPPELLPVQVPPVAADEFTGEPGFSAPLYECDFAATKPRCDVILNGSCYAPNGVPATRVDVGLQVGSMRKWFAVVGARKFQMGLVVGLAASKPQPFTVMPISYNNAYGGVDKSNSDPAKHTWHPLNHAGVGHHPNASSSLVIDKPLPNTEAPNDPITRPNGKHVPMAFGPIGRGWKQRIKWAGTYDKAWKDNKFPFLPDDFDPHYFQSAPEDQWIIHPKGSEEVALINLTPAGRTSFRLPADLRLPILFADRDGKVAEIPAVVDTVLIEPDHKRFMLVWRGSVPVRRTIREIRTMTIGKIVSGITREKHAGGQLTSLAGLAAQNARR